MTNDSSRTQKEFVDYRLNQTDRKIGDVSDSINKRLDIIDTKLDNNFATKDYVNGKLIPVEARLADLESDRTWLLRLVIGLIIVGIIGAVVRFK